MRPHPSAISPLLQDVGSLSRRLRLKQGWQHGGETRSATRPRSRTAAISNFTNMRAVSTRETCRFQSTPRQSLPFPHTLAQPIDPALIDGLAQFVPLAAARAAWLSVAG
jgi:hypothetical protein